MHLHTIGLHLLPEIVKLPKLACIELSEDPNIELKGMKLLEFVREKVPPEMIVIVAIRPDDFLDALINRKLPGNTIYNVCEEGYQDIECWNVDYANELMKRVRDYKLK